MDRHSAGASRNGRWDDRCCETEAWQCSAGVDGLRRGPEQPFYHVLIDQRDWAKGSSTPNSMLAYVAEEMLVAPEVRTCLVCLQTSSPARAALSGAAAEATSVI